MINIPVLFFNFIDFNYFKFTGKRTTADFFSFIATGNDFTNTLPKLIIDFWYVLLLFIVFIWLLVFLYDKTFHVQSPNNTNENKLIHGLLLIPFIGLLIISARGGLQYKPISILTAARYTSPKNVSLVLNTPFCIMKTIGKSELHEMDYFPENKYEVVFNTRKQFNYDPTTFKKLNVVVIIMESFSKEYIGGLNNYAGYTPFLDSLMKESYVFTNAYANAKKSIEGIPAVTASIPALMENPYITSAYNGNTINSLANLLKNKGYASSFFHGGNNGTMGFDNFCKMAGYDKYYGRNEYPDQNDYDGSWGIYDGPFLNFFCKELNKMKQPFLSTIFTISSHHPYSLPVSYRDSFKTVNSPLYRSVLYADQSLENFFHTASQQSWYNNTLFVITADHTGQSEKEEYQTKTGMYAVPIIYFYPGGTLKGKSDRVTQQCDILPTVLDYLHYAFNFNAFGQSAFDSTGDHFAVNYINELYQVIQGDYALQFDGEKIVGFYNYKNDPLEKNNLAGQNNSQEKLMADKLKAIIQEYNYKMIHNKLVE